MAEFGLLLLLWLRALGWRRRRSRRGIAIGYAVTDELHQTFVEGRARTPVDVLIDAAGVALAGLGRGVHAGGGRAAAAAAPGYSQPRSVAMRTACARSTAPSLP